MSQFTPAFLLDNEDLVAPLAPWCVWLDNLELAILLLAQPWIGGGLRRAELEQQLVRVGADLPVGPVYFQRVNRATATLVNRGQLESLGSGRQRRFATTSRGFAALLFNLQVLRADPTVDGSEFELKRSLVSLWNLIVDRFLQGSEELALDGDLIRLFNELEELELWTHRIITDQTVSDAFNILRLIETQRARVERLAKASETRLRTARMQQQLLGAADSSQPNPQQKKEGTAITPEQAMAAVQLVVASTAPQMAAAANLVRYRNYLHYLDDLTTMYATELKVVDLTALRSAMAGRRT
jgi:hypothetical protein